MKKKFVFRCDAGNIPEIGTGHVSRCLLIAKSLIKENICSKEHIVFAIRKEGSFSLGFKTIKKFGFETICTKDNLLIPNSESERQILSENCQGVIILDRLKTEANFIKNLRSKGHKILTLDDQGSGAIETNLSINAILEPLVIDKNIFTGYDYLVIEENNISKKPKPNKLNLNSKFKIFASFGGYDHLEYLEKILKMIEKNIDSGSKDFEYRLVGQSDFIKKNKLRIEEFNKYTENSIYFYSKPKNFYQLMAESDLAIVNGGLTIFDAIARCIPSIGLPQYEHQLKTLKKLEKEGLVYLVSNIINFSEKELYESFSLLIKNSNIRKKIKQNCMGKIDGQGLQRITILLHSLLRK